MPGEVAVANFTLILGKSPDNIHAFFGLGEEHHESASSSAGHLSGEGTGFNRGGVDSLDMAARNGRG